MTEQMPRNEKVFKPLPRTAANALLEGSFRAGIGLALPLMGAAYAWFGEVANLPHWAVITVTLILVMLSLPLPLVFLKAISGVKREIDISGPKAMFLFGFFITLFGPALLAFIFFMENFVDRRKDKGREGSGALWIVSQATRLVFH